jgi:hypothetical protein
MNKETSWFFDCLNDEIPFCYVRFNDGEMMGISLDNAVVARGDQLVDPSLKSKLTEAITHRQENYYVGIPCSACYPSYNNVAKNLVGDYENVKSAVALTNRNWKAFYDNFPASTKNKKILWIGGKDQNPENLKNYGLNIEKTIRVPNKNSWQFYEKIKHTAQNLFDQVDIVCVSLGPTARILCYEWFKEYKTMTFLDMGSLLDPVTRGVQFGAHKGWAETGFNLVPPCGECN